MRRLPPVPLPSYAIELIRAEFISIVPKRSRKSEMWRPPKIEVANVATINAMRIPSAIRILRIFLTTADYANFTDKICGFVILSSEESVTRLFQGGAQDPEMFRFSQHDNEKIAVHP